MAPPEAVLLRRCPSTPPLVPGGRGRLRAARRRSSSRPQRGASSGRASGERRYSQVPLPSWHRQRPGLQPLLVLVGADGSAARRHARDRSRSRHDEVDRTESTALPAVSARRRGVSRGTDPSAVADLATCPRSAASAASSRRRPASMLPVIHGAASLARKQTSSATSSVVPKRPSGISARIFCSISSDGQSRSAAPRRVEGAGRDRVHADAERGPLRGQALRHGLDAGLRARRVHDAGLARRGVGRADVHDAAAAVPHEPADLARHVEDAVQRDVDDRLEALRRQEQRRGRRSCPRRC